MESGLEGRNNARHEGARTAWAWQVSMESGLEGRNNIDRHVWPLAWASRLNGVRPRRPEQWVAPTHPHRTPQGVSMESGLEGRNNWQPIEPDLSQISQVSMESGLEGRNNGPAAQTCGGGYRKSQWSPA